MKSDPHLRELVGAHPAVVAGNLLGGSANAVCAEGINCVGFTESPDECEDALAPRLPTQFTISSGSVVGMQAFARLASQPPGASSGH